MGEKAARKYTLFSIAVVVSFALDQLTKAWAAQHLQPLGPMGMSVYRRNIILIYAQNPGIAFSRLQSLTNGRILLSLVSFVALGLVIFYLRSMPAARRGAPVALGLIFGGALGNLIDRIRLGKVTDFVLVDTGFWPLNPWPVFNVADAVLVIGVGLLLLGSRSSPADGRTTPG